MARIPEGFSTITPQIVVSDAKKAIDLYQKALGAQSMGVMTVPGSDKVVHSALKIGTSVLFVTDELEQFPRKAPKGTDSCAFYLYVDDADAAYKKAVDAGMTSQSEPMDMFWGDRTAVVNDPFGYNWTFATHVRDVPEDEMMKAMESMMG
ncbi:VOC family protein [Sinorhizobium chiapasense]|uniref:VOC family protein n=1 Tax=Sinorhizobium chiapasense TaxID=501572 RepID=A0ABZ2BKD9_9HYPH